MSDDLQERIDDTRAHRCLPPKPSRIGKRFLCDCGKTYQVVPTLISGRQWLPVGVIAKR